MTIKEKLIEVIKFLTPWLDLNNAEVEEIANSFIKNKSKDNELKNEKMKAVKFIDSKGQQLALFDSIIFNSETEGPIKGFIFDYFAKDQIAEALLFLSDKKMLMEITLEQSAKLVVKIQEDSEKE